MTSDNSPGSKAVRALPDYIRADRIAWKANARLFTILHYSLGITAIVSSVLGSVKVDQAVNAAWFANLVFVSRLVAAMCTGAMTFLNLEKRTRAYQRAFVAIDRACGKFESGMKIDLEKKYDAACKIKDSADF